MVIKVVLMLGIAGAALLMLRGYSGARHQAIRRLLLLAFVMLAGASLLVPQLWTAAAGMLGVGRGTDLLLYLTIVTFLGFVATSYLRFRDLQRQITAMARRLALDEAAGEALGAPRPAADDHGAAPTTGRAVAPRPAPRASTVRTGGLPLLEPGRAGAPARLRGRHDPRVTRR